MNPEKKVLERQASRDQFIEEVQALVHKLSQPLTAMHGSLELALLQEDAPGECRRIFRESLEEADRMMQTLALLREVLDAEDPGEDSPLPQ